jgi:hypothetical protein
MDYFRDAIGGDTMEATQVAEGFTKATPEQWAKMSPEARQSYLKAAKANATKPQEQPAPTDYFRDAIGATPSKAAAQPQPADPNATPDAPTWIGRRIQDVTGKQDPRFADVPAFRPDAAGFDGVGKGTYAAGVIAGNSDDGMADMIAKQLGPRHIKTERDGNGYPIIHYYDDQGLSQKAYVNRPGLDVQDIARAAGGSIPYMLTGGAAGAAVKGAGTLAQTGAQALTAGVTNLATQGARGATGSEQSLDPAEAAITTVAGGAAPVIGAAAKSLWSKIVAVPGLYDKTSGTLTQQGIEAAKRAGLDPTDLTPDAIKQFAKDIAGGMANDAAAASANAKMFGAPLLRSQITKDPEHFLVEKAMKQGAYGEDVKSTFKGITDQQNTAFREAAFGGGAERNVAGVLAPHRVGPNMPASTAPYELGATIREGVNTAKDAAKAANSEAWKNVEMEATKEALPLLQDHVRKGIASTGIGISEKRTPTAHEMGVLLDGFMAGEAPVASSAKIYGTPSMTANVGEMRKQLSAMVGDAATGTDRSASRAVYNAFNDWIDEAAKKNLLAGDPSAALNLKVARGLHAEIKSLFEPNQNGVATAGAKRIAAVLKTADSPEAVLSQLLGSGPKVVPAGSVEAMNNMVTALNKFADPEIAKQTIGDLKLAYFARLVQNRAGQMYGYDQVVTNLRTAMTSQRSMVNALMDETDKRMIMNYLKFAESLAVKDPNPSGTATALMTYGKSLLSKVIEKMGGKYATAALDATGLPNAFSAAAGRQELRKVVSSPVARRSNALNPNLAGPIVGATNALARD